MENLIEFGESRKYEAPISKVFDYDGTNVTFARKGDVVMINATQMGRKFGKRVSDWVANQATKDFLNALTDARKSVSADFQAIKIVKGGNGKQGTWLHEDAAIEFARWLSPAFAIWCNDRIKELLTIGITATPQTIESIIADPDNGIRLLQALKHEREEKQRLAIENKQQAVTIEEQKPKVAFADAMLSSPDSILVNELAKILCQNGYKTGEIRLYNQLRNEGYLCKCGSDFNLPRQEYLEMGLFEITKGTRSGKDGVLHHTRTTKVTPKGVKYFVNKFVKHEPSLFGSSE